MIYKKGDFLKSHILANLNLFTPFPYYFVVFIIFFDIEAN